MATRPQCHVCQRSVYELAQLIILCISAFQFNWNVPSEDSTGPRNRRSNSPLWPTQPWFTVLLYLPTDNPPILPCFKTLLTVSQRCTSPLEEQAAANSLQTLRRTFEQRGISSQATDIIIQSWTPGTQKQYQPYIKKWLEFCHGRENNPYDSPIATVLDFLVSLHEKGLGYSTLNTARGAISVIVLPHNDVTIGSNPIISRFMKGIFKTTRLHLVTRQHGTLILF